MNEPAKENEKNNDETDRKKQTRKNASTISDVIFKLASAIAVIFAAFIANSYQTEMTAVTILSEREKAESELRSTMFNNLIGPISGPFEEGKGISLKREKLMVELLALNFHEHFEFKPLMEFVDERLIKELIKEDAEKERDSLRSIARRIADRQINSLINEAGNINNDKAVKALQYNDLSGQQHHSIASPDGKYTVEVGIANPDFDNWNFLVSVAIKQNNDPNNDYIGEPRQFTITAFDFPFTDNAVIDSNNRFALVLDNVEPAAKEVYLKLVWFPKDFITPSERPINYSELRKSLKMNKENDTIMRKMGISF